VTGFLALLLVAFWQSPGAPRAPEPPARSVDAEDEQPVELRVPRMGSAGAQLDHARGLKATLHRRSDPEDREFWRRLAVEAYQAVRHYHPQERGLGAEASFRAGELLRAAGREIESIDEFRQAVRLGRDTEFRARARLEIGHVRRRRDEARLALDAYLEVASDASAAARHRDDAWLWAGRLWCAQGRVEDARRAWRGVADDGADPLDRVLAHDLIAVSWIEHEEDLEAAAGVLEECRRALSAPSLEETRSGERVRNALLRMRVVPLLKERVARRTSERERARARTDGRRNERKP